MFPSQTSLIPVGVALARFLGEKGLTAFSSNYPYWYLGTTPYRFLTGPIIPVLTVLFKKIVSGASYFDILIVLILLACLISALGWTFLVVKIKEEKLNFSSFLVYFLLFAILPWKYLSGLALSEPSAFIAEMLIPFVLLAINKNRYWGILAVFLILLVSTNILPILIVGIVTLTLTGSFTGGRIKKWKKPLKTSLIILAVGMALATLYYTPAFWITILTNPSIGGVPGVKAILSLLAMARNMIPIALAFIVIYFSRKITGKINFFGWAWILTFIFLTLWRALGNINFWMDWISWFGGIEIGLGILISANLKKLRYLFLLVLPFLASFLVFKTLGSPELILNKMPAELAGTVKLSEIAGKNLIFTSGTGVFWLNAFYNTSQVRGGRDEVSINPEWFKTSYVLRESLDPATVSSGLEKLGVHYVLVNSDTSRSYYHDFKNVDLWNSIGSVIWQGSGDIIYTNQLH